jgi:hypothetical protein
MLLHFDFVPFVVVVVVSLHPYNSEHEHKHHDHGKSTTEKDAEPEHKHGHSHHDHEKSVEDVAVVDDVPATKKQAVEQTAVDPMALNWNVEHE